MQNFIGHAIGRYHVFEPLGEGGMATVYKAFDTSLERVVAIKVIRKEAFLPEQFDSILKRFEREALFLAKMAHPNIVKIHDFGEYKGSPYLVMEYLCGGTLKQLLGKPIPFTQGASILLPVARALDYSHRHNVLHRDVKPSNILFNEESDPFLSDFGVAKILEKRTSNTLTGVGVGLGTPEYMAPEQWFGMAVPRSDLYSLGVIFFEMVTGHLPYTAEDRAEILLKQISDRPPQLKQFNLDLPEEAEKLILKTLAIKPEDRFESIEQFINSLLPLTFTTKRENTISTPIVETVSAVVVPDVTVKVCPHCGREILPSAKFCNFCGKLVRPIINKSGQKWKPKKADALSNSNNLKHSSLNPTHQNAPKSNLLYWFRWVSIVLLGSLLIVIIALSINHPISGEISVESPQTTPIIDMTKTQFWEVGETAIATRIPTIIVTPEPIKAYVSEERAIVYKGPGSNYRMVCFINEGAKMTIISRNQDGSWLGVQFPSSLYGYIIDEESNKVPYQFSSELIYWVSRANVTITGILSDVDIVAAPPTEIPISIPEPVILYGNGNGEGQYP